MELRELLDKSGIRVSELAILLKVNRVTVSNWLNSHTTPRQAMTIDAIRHMSALIETGIDRGAFPIKKDIPYHQRLTVIREILSGLYRS